MKYMGYSLTVVVGENESVPTNALEELNNFREAELVIEPETHLHPIQQIEIIEELIKRFASNKQDIILTTSSAFVLRSVQVYAANNSVADKIQYYLNSDKLINCTNNIDILYRTMTKPLQVLEDAQWDIDGEEESF